MSLYTPVEPGASPLSQPPLEIAADTFVLRGIYNTPTMSTNLNAMLIRGSEPILVDTGMVLHRESWWRDVCSLVDSADIRWIFVTHDDCDHTGNLLEALDHCPNARVIVNKASSWRSVTAFGLPMERVQTVNDGESFTLGERRFLAARPPVYDSPYTLGLLDESTRVYYASDAFCTPMPPQPVDYVDEMTDEFWARGMAVYHQNSLCPWISLVDSLRFAAEVGRLGALDIDVIAGAHTPVIRSASVPAALELLADLPGAVRQHLDIAGVGAPLSPG
ncbi:MBL fold metallo-hydrolase [Haliea sp. E17]|uniref:MBL fold metallo-hydrolase n=1 Tax=Haliea sp. E17 TaxID=3401576 RepID=UPI003AAAD39F